MDFKKQLIITQTTLPNSSEKLLGIVIPLANEEGTIDDLLIRILRQVPPTRTKIFCVVDRVSKDNTLEKVRDWAGRDLRVVPIWAPENRCVVDAYFRGYREALAHDCDWILEMDGGLSHSPEEIPRFLNAMAQGYEYAGGSRFMKGSCYSQPGKRYLISLLGTWLTNILVGTRMKDMTSGFECFTKRALQRVISDGVKSRAHFFQTEIRTMMHDFSWVEIPISYRSPSSIVGVTSLKEAFINLWALRRQRKAPHLSANRLGFLLLALSGLIVAGFLLFKWRS